MSTARNDYLNSQQAFFLYDASANEQFQSVGTFRPVDDVILAMAKRDETWTTISERGAVISEFCKPPIMKRFLLPCTEADHLLELLYQEDISYAHLMPTLDNVVRTLDFMRLRARGAF